MPKRFFSFGCSHTAFAWPTWPDIVGLNFPDNYYNLGRSGAGNTFIFNHFIEMNERYKFNKDDLIIIQWTEYMREDRYLNRWWHTNGNIINGYPVEYIRQYADPRGFVMRDLSFIAAVTQILDAIGCEYHYLNLNDFNCEPDIAETFAPYLAKIKPSFLDVLGERKQRMLANKVFIEDLHPTPGEHYRYLEAVLPQWLPEDKNIGKEWDELLASVWHTHNEGWDYTWPGIDRGFAKLSLGL